ncbi:putativeinactive leucine-rich repeat receptor-like protein kinase [Quercus suber]|uniref:Putativeinactive leucine-rich repeat receptor-like protein kinase n=1 Tax=Quercus suber TaxID=58331 RepID=A0AAW0K3I9_QUESU
MFQNPRGNNIFIGSDVDAWELGYGRNPLKLKNFANNSNGSLVDWTALLLTSSFDLHNVIDESLIGRGFEDEIFELLRINGNIYDWLHAVKGRHKILKWPLRIKIAIGIARGLAWLHHYCNFRVVHLNLSSNSILLDQTFEPKI